MKIYLAINRTSIEQNIQNSSIRILSELRNTRKSDRLESLIDASSIAMEFIMPRNWYELNASLQIVLLDMLPEMRVDDEGAEISEVIYTLDKGSELEVTSLADAVHDETHVIDTIELVRLDLVARDHVVEAALHNTRSSSVARHQVAQFV